MEANAPQWHTLGFLGGVWGLLEWQQQPAAHEQGQSITDDQIDLKVSELSAEHVHRQLSMWVPPARDPTFPLLPSLDFTSFSTPLIQLRCPVGPRPTSAPLGKGLCEDGVSVRRVQYSRRSISPALLRLTLNSHLSRPALLMLLMLNRAIQKSGKHCNSSGDRRLIKECPNYTHTTAAQIRTAGVCCVVCCVGERS